MITLENLFQCFFYQWNYVLQMIQLVIDRWALSNDEPSHECNGCKARRDNRNIDLSSKTGTENREKPQKIVVAYLCKEMNYSHSWLWHDDKLIFYIGRWHQLIIIIIFVCYKKH